MIMHVHAGVTNYVTSNGDSGPGTLRQAILDLNAAGGGKILFSNLNGPIAFSSPLPSFQTNIRLAGSEASVPLLSGTNVFQVASNAVVQFHKMDFGNMVNLDNHGTVVFSKCFGPSSMFAMNTGSLTLKDGSYKGFYRSLSIFGSGRTSIRAVNYHNIVINGGTVEMLNCTVSGGRSVGRNGYSYTVPPPCSFPANCCGYFAPTQGRGGGILIESGSVTLTGCRIENNHAAGGAGVSCGAARYGYRYGEAGRGGGICMENGDLSMTNCAIFGNSAGGGGDGGGLPGGGSGVGGGICIGRGRAILVGCTISGNRANGGGFAGSAYGAGVAIESSSVFLRMVSCTVTENVATPTVGGWYYPPFSIYGIRVWNASGQGIGGLAALGNVSLENTIIARNTGAHSRTNGELGYVQLPSDVSGEIASAGHNLIGTTNFSTTSSGFTNFDLVGVDPLLGPLQDNGGPVPTHALLAISPAIDAGRTTGTVLDGRGQLRTIDHPDVANFPGSDGTDIGALEVDPVLRATDVRRLGDDVWVRFTSVSDKAYRVQFKGNLDGTLWMTLDGIVQGTGGNAIFIDVGAGNAPLRFYRVFVAGP